MCISNLSLGRCVVDLKAMLDAIPNYAQRLNAEPYSQTEVFWQPGTDAAEVLGMFLCQADTPVGFIHTRSGWVAHASRAENFIRTQEGNDVFQLESVYATPYDCLEVSNFADSLDRCALSPGHDAMRPVSRRSPPDRPICYPRAHAAKAHLLRKRTSREKA